MATQTSGAASAELNLAPNIRSKLSGLRTRIRLYVWLEGLSLMCIWLGLTFWLAFALDRMVVVLVGAELPVWTRAFLLAYVALVAGFILVYWIFSRAFAPLPDHSMAVLLERRYGNFNDSLVTAVEMSETPDHARQFNREMLDRANERAVGQIDRVSLGNVFNIRRLVWRMVLALLLLLPAGVLWGDTLRTAVDRLVLLRPVAWPRSARIEVEGVQVQRSQLDPNVTTPPLVPFVDKSVKVARHSSLTLRVRADVTAPRVPETCTIWYETEDGDRGRVTMKKIGRPQGKYQSYTFDEKPFKGILSGLKFTVRGYDAHERNYRVTVVDNPTIVETELDCTFPPYMVDERLSQWMPRTESLTTSTELPIGTRVVIRARSNKPLEKVVLVNTETQEATTILISEQNGPPDQFLVEVPALEANLSLDATLFDTDGVVTDKPHRLFIAARPDEPPRVDVVLKGIGTAVTPDVLVPVTGTVEDDYAVAETWLEAMVEDSSAESFPLQLKTGGKLEASIDFRQQRAEDEGLALNVGNKLLLTVKSSDKFNLGGEGPNVGAGDGYQLEVVSADQLLAILERRELGLRQRFEQIIEEVTAMRDSLDRVRVDLSGSPTADAALPEAGDEPVDEEAAEQRARSLRLLWTQRAVIQSQKSAQEVLGVAGSFDDIRQELINNRVDTEDRKARLQEQIAEPLQLIGESMFPELDRLLQELEANLDDADKGPPASQLVMRQTDDILAELDKVLQKMLELETFNELVDIVRDLIEEQRNLIEATEKERKRQALELLK